VNNSSNDKTLKILVVSQNLDALKYSREIMATEGYSVITASTLDEAYRLCERLNPSLFIYDINSFPGTISALIKMLPGFLVKDS
jgi:DNA-binding response OmpR family regulator